MELEVDELEDDVLEDDVLEDDVVAEELVDVVCVFEVDVVWSVQRIPTIPALGVSSSKAVPIVPSTGCGLESARNHRHSWFCFHRSESKHGHEMHVARFEATMRRV